MTILRMFFNRNDTILKMLYINKKQVMFFDFTCPIMFVMI